MSTALFANETRLFEILQRNPQEACLLAIDEVGRGCVAGPVLTAVSLWIAQKETKHPTWLLPLRDSKKMTQKQREVCYFDILKEFSLSPHDLPIVQTPQKISLGESLFPKKIKGEDFSEIPVKENISFRCVDFSLGLASAEEIDAVNIWQAIQLSIARCLLDLKRKNPHSLENAVLLMDGSLSIAVPQGWQKNPQICVTKADDLFKSVSFSSVMAKVKRDALMTSFSEQYPAFSFAKNKGYGTPDHLKAVTTAGLSPLHRSSFLRSYTESPALELFSP